MARRLYVGNISYKTTEELLKESFEKDGRSVVDCKIITDRETGRSRGFGFIEFSSEEEAKSAIEAMNGTELDGRELRVSLAHEKKSKDRDRRW